MREERRQQCRQQHKQRRRQQQHQRKQHSKRTQMQRRLRGWTLRSRSGFCGTLPCSSGWRSAAVAPLAAAATAVLPRRAAAPRGAEAGAAAGAGARPAGAAGARAAARAAASSSQGFLPSLQSSSRAAAAEAAMLPTAWHLHQQSCLYLHSCNCLAHPLQNLRWEHKRHYKKHNYSRHCGQGALAKLARDRSRQGNRLALQWGWSRCNVTWESLEVHWGV